MSSSLARVGDNSTFCSLKNWQDLVEIEPMAREKFAMRLRDPLLRQSVAGAEILAVFGYKKNTSGTSLVYFWDSRMGALGWKSISRMPDIGDHLQLAHALLHNQESQPSLEQALNFDPDKFTRFKADPTEWIKGKKVYWRDFGTMRFASIYVPGGRTKSSTAVGDCLNFHYDYFQLATPICGAIPMNYLASLCGESASNLCKLHIEPKCFSPFEKSIEGSFAWPWQACIISDEDGGGVTYRPIETTSIAVDIRKSTLAMEMLRRGNVGQFPKFISAIVEAAKEEIFRFGGFFDKETGDGLVGHFTDFPELCPEDDAQHVTVRAFNAGIAIIGRVRKICESFQDELTLRVGDLCPAIGLHNEKAVWICEKTSVRAVGASVILAARLCDEADTQSIFVSNDFFQKLSDSPSISANLMTKFEEKEYTGKEYGSGSSLYAYQIKVPERLVNL